MRGRKPTPDRVKELLGMTTKHRCNCKPSTTGPPPTRPPWLDGTAGQVWGEVVPGLIAAGLISRLDEVVLCGFCQAASLARMAQAILSAEGMTVTTSRGDTRKHPALSILKDMLILVRQLGSELGLTPVARARLVGHASTPADPLDEFLQGPATTIAFPQSTDTPNPQE